MLKAIKGRTLSPKIFIWSSALMFLIATAHISLALYRALMRYVWLAGSSESQTYGSTARRSENQAYISLAVIMVWIFNCLLIYRCYIIWSKRWYIVVLPIVLFLGNIAIDILVVAWWCTKDPEKQGPYKLLSRVSLPITAAQNVLTTGLICYRLARQHRISRASGIQPSRSRLNLFHVVRIMVESAAIYTILLLITIVFQTINSRSMSIFLAMKTPTIGIVSTLISIRLNIVVNRAREPRTTLFALPTWINNIPPSQSVTDNDQSTSHEMKSPSVETRT